MTDEIFYKQLDEYNKLIGITQRLVDHDLPYINRLMDEINMNSRNKGSVTISLKSLVGCFEEIRLREQRHRAWSK